MKSAVFDLEANGTTIGVHHWAPEGQVVGVVQVLHGLAEHGGRYVGVADSLTQHGWVVVAGDHRGHGLSAQSEEDLGFFAERDGWNKVVEDVRALDLHLAHQYPKVPHVVLGHSMGSLLARDFASRHGDDIDGLVLSGTPRPQGLIGMAGRALARSLSASRGPRSKGSLLHQLTFGNYNNAFTPARTEYDWLTRDTDIVDDYVADERCGFVATNGLFVDLIGGLQRVNQPKVATAIPHKLPIRVVGGGLDPVGGVRALDALRQLFKQAGLKKVEGQVYDGARHEVFNETNRAEVHRDLVTWLEQFATD